MNVCPDYCNTPLLFLSIPSLPFPFDFNPPARQVPPLQKVINVSKYLQSKSKLLCRPYQTFWTSTLANLCIYFHLHPPKLLIFFLSLSLLLPLHGLSFPFHPVKSSQRIPFWIQVLLPPIGKLPPPALAVGLSLVFLPGHYSTLPRILTHCQGISSVGRVARFLRAGIFFLSIFEFLASSASPENLKRGGQWRKERKKREKEGKRKERRKKGRNKEKTQRER